MKVQTPSDPAAPLKLLEAGKVDLAISYEPELLIARDKGAKLVSVGAIAQVPLTTLMSLKRGFNGPRDLRGGRVGTAGIPYQSAYLQTILQRAGVPVDAVKETNVGFNLVPAMLSKRVDATLGAFWNVEGVQLKRQKRRPRILPVDHVGVPSYDELVLVARVRGRESRSAGGDRRARESGTRPGPQIRARERHRIVAGVLPCGGLEAVRLAGPEGVERLR